ncbi:MAG: nucleotidyltransferase family protein [Acidimicrobiia bacterium]|nr:nucleotidyltransferase family protein [Acidimicrobiia bacterium]
MTEARAPGELLELVGAHIATWAPVVRQRHGFDLLVGDATELARQRRQQARTVLVSEAVLADLGATGAGPVVLMKGLEVAQLYPALTHRPFRDVDVLVRDAPALWQRYVDAGYRPNPRRRVDIDHHHLPALAAPHGPVGVELHHRPNLPAWVQIDAERFFETAQPSRTGIEGVRRPRDDLHALLMAMHGWIGGFARLRDLLDALLLASVSAVPVAETAAELGLRRFWTWTERIAEAELLGRASPLTRGVTRALVPRRAGRSARTRTRVLAPYLVANPIAVTRGHAADYRLGREARRLTAPSEAVGQSGPPASS